VAGIAPGQRPSRVERVGAALPVPVDPDPGLEVHPGAEEPLELAPGGADRRFEGGAALADDDSLLGVPLDADVDEESQDGGIPGRLVGSGSSSSTVTAMEWGSSSRAVRSSCSRTSSAATNVSGWSVDGARRVIAGAGREAGFELGGERVDVVTGAGRAGDVGVEVAERVAGGGELGGDHRG